jgi:hypothetical protein
MKTNEEILLDLANKLKGLRKIKGVTQEQVYNDTSIHIARINKEKEIYPTQHLLNSPSILK